jgi:outer membrane autotransporter protein
VNTDDALSRGEVGSGFTSVYGGYRPGRGYIQSTLSYGRGNYDVSRWLEIGALQRESRADYDGDVFSWSVKGGYGFPLGDWSLEPFALVDWLSSDEDAVVEIGADAAGCLVDERTNDWLIGELGVRFVGRFAGRKGKIHPEFLAAWSRDFDGDDREITAAFADAPDVRFTVPGRDIERSGAVLGAGFVYAGKQGWTGGIRLDGDFRSETRAYGLVGQFRYRF